MGRVRAPRLHFVLQQIAVSTGCIPDGNCHSLDMRRKSSKRLKMKVFIVDDSKVVVERLADLLEEVSDAKLVGQAGAVHEAIPRIQQMKPDALILDLQLPDGSGLDVLRAVRQDAPQLVILICTNYPYAKYREECLAAGANFFLDKTTEFARIPNILREMMQREVRVSPTSR